MGDGEKNGIARDGVIDQETASQSLPQSASNHQSPAHSGTPCTSAGKHWRDHHRVKTTSVAIVLCLHIGIDPPDLIRPPDGGARMICWTDPLSMPPDKARETIGRTLQQQYEYWQSRAKYRVGLDPTGDDVKKMISALRRSTGNAGRMIVHYNGSGVPRPTRNGELWLFNRQFTQYIPFHVKELISCIDGPSLLVFDCSMAGYLLNAACQADDDIMVLASCSPGQTLPMGNHELPADLFTSCLTTPMEVALRLADASIELPGRLNDRQSVLGELNWILTAILDSIAWQTVPDRGLFQRLFRQDLLLASLFKNFLLASHVMRPLGCHPMSHPPLPTAAISVHPLWQAWSFEVDRCMGNSGAHSHASLFFKEQQMSFEYSFAAGALPIILQLLLSQQHRTSALWSFVKYIRHGSDGVLDALQVGLYPYVLKLLQSAAVQRPLLWLWLHILDFDVSCKDDLVKEDALQYFVNCLLTDEDEESRMLACAILCKFLAISTDGSLAPFKDAVASHSLSRQLSGRLGAWKVCLLGLLCRSNAVDGSSGAPHAGGLHFSPPHARLPHGSASSNMPCDGDEYTVDQIVNVKAICKLLKRTDDPADALLRQAAVYCVGRIVSQSASPVLVLSTLAHLVDDPSKGVREEVVLALSHFVACHRATFIRTAYAVHQQRPVCDDEAVYEVVWKTILCLAMDPVERISRLAGHLIDEVQMAFLFPALPQQREQHESLQQVVFVPLSKSTDDLQLLDLRHDRDDISTGDLRLLHIASSPPADDDSHGWTWERMNVQVESVLPMPSAFPNTLLDDLLWCHGGHTGPDEPHDRQKIRNEFEIQDALIDQTTFDHLVSLIDTGSPVMGSLFCCDDDGRIVTHDGQAVVTVWQCDQRSSPVRTNIFRNGRCGAVRDMLIVRDMLAVSSEDGGVRIWKSYQYGQEQLASAWMTLSVPVLARSSAGGTDLVYSQGSHLCFWDIAGERLVQKRNCSDHISAIVHHPHQYFVGSKSGKLLHADDRCAHIKECVSVSGPIGYLGSFMNDGHIIFSGAEKIIGWDLRAAKLEFELSCTASTKTVCHPLLPYFMVSHENSVSTYHYKDCSIHKASTIKYHEGLLGKKIGAISHLSVHPSRPLFAMSSMDNTVSIFN